MDRKELLHLIASLTAMVGEKNMAKELDLIGWHFESHPVEYFRGYLEEFKDRPDEQERIDMIKDDLTNVAHLYDLEVTDDDIVDIVTR